MKKVRKTIFMPKADWELVSAALRDPRNKQGKNRMFDGEGYCCLGVMKCAKTGGRVELDNADDPDSDFGGLPTMSWLQSVGWRFKNERGLSDDCPFLPSLGMLAIEASDDAGYSFAEIADAIESCVQFTD